MPFEVTSSPVVEIEHPSQLSLEFEKSECTAYGDPVQVKWIELALNIGPSISGTTEIEIIP